MIRTGAMLEGLAALSQRRCVELIHGASHRVELAPGEPPVIIEADYLWPDLQRALRRPALIRGQEALGWMWLGSASVTGNFALRRNPAFDTISVRFFPDWSTCGLTRALARNGFVSLAGRIGAICSSLRRFQLLCAYRLAGWRQPA